jgi:hypothetical protein
MHEKMRRPREYMQGVAVGMLLHLAAEFTYYNVGFIQRSSPVASYVHARDIAAGFIAMSNSLRQAALRANSTFQVDRHI